MIIKKTIVVILSTVLVTTLVLMIVFWLWLEIYMTYSTIVSVSAYYRVTVPGKPAASARLYDLGSPHEGFGENSLLVLTPKSSGRREPYFINWSRREIGLPNFPKYVPLLDGAIIDRSTLMGFPLIGEIEAEWSVKNDKDEIHILIKGFKEKESGDEEVMRENMPIGYQREIIFTRKFQR